MNKEELQKFICAQNLSVVEAMKKIDSNSSGLLYVVDDNVVLLGCVTDGDIRRWMINGGSLDAKIANVMNTSPISVKHDEINDVTIMMNEKQISSVAVVNDNCAIEDVVFLRPKIESVKHKDILKDITTIVMAGGKGTRLYPYTKILPKPLIPIGDIPILERILNRFAEYGVQQFYITVNYKKEMIKSYFSEIKHSYEIQYIEEDVPLGTAGGIRFIKGSINKTVLITNCDILIDADYNDIMEYHVVSGNDLTIVSSLKNTVIPYGILHSKEGGIITSMEEKPELSHFINTGMYIMNRKYIDWIPEAKMFHMTDLADLMIKKNRKVGMFPISENSFLDMGEFEELKKMEERINAGFVL